MKMIRQHLWCFYGICFSIFSVVEHLFYYIMLSTLTNRFFQSGKFFLKLPSSPFLYSFPQVNFLKITLLASISCCFCFVKFAFYLVVWITLAITHSLGRSCWGDEKRKRYGSQGQVTNAFFFPFPKGTEARTEG